VECGLERNAIASSTDASSLSNRLSRFTYFAFFSRMGLSRCILRNDVVEDAKDASDPEGEGGRGFPPPLLRDLGALGVSDGSDILLILTRIK
jgi:hypothetical protein